MKNTNVDAPGERSLAVPRGWRTPRTASLTVEDSAGSEVQPARILLFGTGFTVTDLDDETALIDGFGVGAPTDHGDLSGLEDDDHPQYTTDAEVIDLISTYAPAGGEPLTNGNEVNPELIFAGGDVVMVGMGEQGGGASSSDIVNPMDFGAAADCKFVSDAAVDGGSLSTVTSATAAFVSGDTGKTFTLRTSAGAVTTGTLTFVNSTTCTMSSAAGGAITGGWLIWFSDDWQAWQDAASSAQPGQTVTIPGGFRSGLDIATNGSLSIPTKVTLLGTGIGPFDPQTNPAGNTWGPTLVFVADTTDPAIAMATQAGLGDGIFYTANQVHPAHSTPTAFAALVKVNNGGCHIGKVYMPNAYRGVDVWAGRTYIDTVVGGFFASGVRIDHALDIVRIRHIGAHPFWRLCEGQAYTPTAGTLDEFAQDNGRALRVHRADAFAVDYVFSFGLYGAVLAIDSADEQGVECGYGTIGMVDADNCVVGIDAHETNTPGILIHSAFLGANGTGVGTAGAAGIATQTGGSIAPKVVLKSWSHRGTWSVGASSAGAGTTLIVPGTNPG